ncbi:diguanylate cyclase [Rickettsiales endosymbiont of Trichoplax sp. H2]|nr:diguanylate cyclase [Rickettsiales endosymbiont of Trichoplax sp. H2]MSO13671.1 Response regulator PleD [Rickettsiales endosymbiont of Trichoplax sp. H2]
MTAKILIVDDLKFNIDLLEEKLQVEFYEIHRAYNGQDAISKAISIRPDIILMDIMMPIMDGFGATKAIRKTPEISYIPIIIVTALSSIEDKVNSFVYGADDYMNKPINYSLLKLRIKSLIRMKSSIDEIILRAGIGENLQNLLCAPLLDVEIANSKILLVDDSELIHSIYDKLERKNIIVDICKNPDQAVQKCLKNNYSLIIINSEIVDCNAIDIAVKIRNQVKLKHIPILMIIDEYDEDTLIKNLEIGINDYFITPGEIRELIVKSIAQVKKFHYIQNLKSTYLKDANIDELTQVYNRRYLEIYFKSLIKQLQNNEKISIICIIDIDNFKQLNDTWGHITGDKILKSIASILKNNIRSSDFIARIGGEEFIIILHHLTKLEAKSVIEKLSKNILETKFSDYSKIKTVKCTISAGIADINPEDTLAEAINRADKNLYKAKSSGKNTVII